MSKKSTTTVTEIPEFAGKVFNRIYQCERGKELRTLMMCRYDGTEFKYKGHEDAQFDYCYMEPTWPGIPEESIVFENEDFTIALGHDQNCCECVQFESTDIPLSELVGHRIIKVEKRAVHREIDYGDETKTWYIFEVEGVGTCTMRWCGTSNGWYSTAVDVFTEDRTVYNKWMASSSGSSDINSEGKEAPKVVN